MSKPPPLNCCAIEKPSGERYVFLFTDAMVPELFQTLGRFASNKELSFTWWDAAVIAKKVRGNIDQRITETRHGGR